MGISRRAAVVTAYLIATRKITPDEAFAAARAERAIVQPNDGFMSQLQEYYLRCSDDWRANLPEEAPDEHGKRGKRKAL
jgi:protein-tyrosine phosphatase